MGRAFAGPDMRFISCFAPIMTSSAAKAFTSRASRAISMCAPGAPGNPAEIGPADLVLIGLKTTANGALPELLPPLVGPATAVLTTAKRLGQRGTYRLLDRPGKNTWAPFALSV